MADWNPRANEIFLAALEHGADRQAYLQSAFGNDAELRRAVEALLAAHDQLGSFLNAPAAPLGKPAEARTCANDPPAQASQADTDDEALALLGNSREPGGLGRLDHYEILEVAGRGAMGVVFKARDTHLQRIVAVKVLAPKLASDGTSRKRFIREAQSAAGIRDDHVVGIHAVSADGSIPYLVMEFIDGTTLEKRIEREGPLELKEILRIGVQMAEGLAAAHKQGLVHRDIKPANILLENHVQRVKITDFGLARAVENPNLSQPGALAGTPLYMSPEQARGEAVDHRSDLFSLGSVLYKCCTGREAFGADKALAVLKRICEVQPRPIREANPEIPENLAAVVDKLLAKEPAERYQSAAEVADVLRGQLAQVQQRAVPAPVAPVVPKRRLAVALVGLLALAAVAAVVGLLASGWLSSGPAEHAKAMPPATSTPKVLAKEDRDPPKKPKDEDPKPKPPVHPAGVLTVSQNPADQARYSTINAALANVQPGQTIRVLDGAVYEEQLRINQPTEHRGVTLEAAKGKKPTLRMPKGKQPPHEYCVGISHVGGFTLRGLRVIDAGELCDLVYIEGACSGLLLTDLELVSTAGDNHQFGAVQMYKGHLSPADVPVVMQNCAVHGAVRGLVVQGRVRGKWDTPQLCSRIVVRNNKFDTCVLGVVLFGACQQIQIVGNTFVKSRADAIRLADPLHGTADVVFANNTYYRDTTALQIFDDDTTTKFKNVALQCKNMRFQNNLVLGSKSDDLLFFVHERANWQSEEKPGDVQMLLKTWNFSHNWREIEPSANKAWIPGPRDTLGKPLKSLYPKNDLDFPPPPGGSEVATGGVGDLALPPYVGAVPPEGTPPWNWDWTWDALANRRLTVSQKQEGGGRFRTITEALEKVEPGMTIRVLDDAVYEEQIRVNRPDQYRGVTLEAVKGGKIPTIQMTKGKQKPNMFCVQIDGVEGFTLRGFKVWSAGLQCDLVSVVNLCPGTVLTDLDLEAPGPEGGCVFMVNQPLAPEHAPLVIQNCTLHSQVWGIVVVGNVAEQIDQSQPCNRIVIRNNVISGCKHAVALPGACKHIHIVGNKILGCGGPAIVLPDPLPGTSDVLIANNTFYENGGALHIFDDSTNKELKDVVLQCKNMRFQNNLVLQPNKVMGDLLFFVHERGNWKSPNKAGNVPALLEAWQFSHNWRETEPSANKAWIPGPKVTLRKPLDFKFMYPKKGLEFPPPPADSDLATGGVNDGVLPAYVGAVPPEGVPPWDWGKTWKALQTK
jgi:serine/threonine protein kinase